MQAPSIPPRRVTGAARRARQLLPWLLAGLAATGCVVTDEGIRPLDEVLAEEAQAKALPTGSWKDSNGDWLYVERSGVVIQVAPRSALTAASWTTGRGKFQADGLVMEHFRGDSRVDRQVGAPSSDSRTITWTNGSTWRFSDASDRPNAGRWRDSNGDDIDVSMRGDKVLATAVSPKLHRFWTDGEGDLRGSEVSMVHKKSGVVSDRQRGVVAPDGKSISWSNGSTWTWQS